MEVCPENCHHVTDKKHAINFSTCTLSAKCVAACPSSALSILGETMDLDSILEIIKRDIHYYKESGGGVTASGGEPMLQADFVLKLFASCKQRRINTCLDTSGYCSSTALENVLSVTDHVLYDLKIMDNALHIKFTGNGNKIIHENFELAVAMKKEITVRHIIIPGINDNQNEFAGLASFLIDTGFSGALELIPYHSFGKSKYKAIGEQYQLEDISVPEDTEMEISKKFFENKGFQVSIN